MGMGGRRLGLGMSGAVSVSCYPKQYPAMTTERRQHGSQSDPKVTLVMTSVTHSRDRDNRGFWRLDYIEKQETNSMNCVGSSIQGNGS